MSPKLPKLIIVGDMFTNASLLSSEIINFSTLANEKTQVDELELGQGLTTLQLNTLLASNYKISNRTCFESIEDRKNVHKTLNQNIMISPPTAVQEKEFSSFLILSGDNGLLDHITGAHLPGMILIEAARQLMLAITERFLMPQALKYSLRFSINNIHSTFTHFALPIETQLISKIDILSQTNTRHFKANCIVNFWQKKRRHAYIEIQFACLPEDIAMQKEIKDYATLS